MLLIQVVHIFYDLLLMGIQSIIFSKDYHTFRTALDWLQRHHKKYIKVDETTHYYRFRQTTPKKGDLYYTKDIGNGIKLIINF